MGNPLSRRAMLQKRRWPVGGRRRVTIDVRQRSRAATRGHVPAVIVRSAKLAIHCLVEHCDKSRAYLPYFYTRMSDRPATMFLAIWSYGDGQGRSIDALSLLRCLTGGNLDQPADRAMRASLLSLIGDDGLSWCPAEPWTMPLPHTRPNWLQQGNLLALTTLHQLTGEGRYRRLAEKNIQALAGMLVRRPEGWLGFPSDVYTPVDGWAPLAVDPASPFPLWSAVAAMPALRDYRLTGYEPAMKLASDLMTAALRASDNGKRLFKVGHFHCQSRFVTALLMRGILKNDKADVELAESLYRTARGLGTQSGWFPEQINLPADNRSNLSENLLLDRYAGDCDPVGDTPRSRILARCRAIRPQSPTCTPDRRYRLGGANDAGSL